MERITNKNIYRFTGIKKKDLNLTNEQIVDMYFKLVDLENIEEDIDVDIHTLFKALDKKLASLYKNNDGEWKVKPLLTAYAYTPKVFCAVALERKEDLE